MTNVAVYAPANGGKLDALQTELALGGYAVERCSNMGQLSAILDNGGVAVVVACQDETDVEALGEQLWQMSPETLFVVIGESPTPASGWTDLYLQAPIARGEITAAFAQMLGE